MFSLTEKIARPAFLPALAQLQTVKDGFGSALILVFMVGFPERAIETFLYKDLQKHENEMKLIAKQLPQARTFYDAQSPEARARIDRDMEGVQPYYQDKAFVTAALREKDRQTRREFASPTPPKAGAKAAA